MEKPSIEDIRGKYEDQLLSNKGVVGIGISESSDGEQYIEVYVIEKDPELEVAIPKRLEGYKVEIKEVGEIKAL